MMIATSICEVTSDNKNTASWPGFKMQNQISSGDDQYSGTDISTRRQTLDRHEDQEKNRLFGPQSRKLEEPIAESIRYFQSFQTKAASMCCNIIAATPIMIFPDAFGTGARETHTTIEVGRKKERVAITLENKIANALAMVERIAPEERIQAKQHLDTFVDYAIGLGESSGQWVDQQFFPMSQSEFTNS